MGPLPRISIITSSYNQGKFISETIHSVLAQAYPNWEHIVVDGMSTDETLNVLSQFPHLQVIREPDLGQADAINKGFAKATGDILCFLNSDDTLAPGTLQRVAEEIQPSQGRHIIMGRCLFMNEQGHSIDIEHPSFFIDSVRILKIWQGHGVPQPSVFWSREVLEHCGNLDIAEKMVLDYDLFCRFSRHYHFHYIDQVFAHYRLHQQSKTNSMDDETRLEESIRISKRYWHTEGLWLYGQLWLSLLNFRRQQRGKKYFTLVKSDAPISHWSRLFALIAGSLLFPERILYAKFSPWLKIKLKQSPSPAKLLERCPQTKAYFSYHKQWDDQWVGPHFELFLQTTTPARSIIFLGETIYKKKLSLHIEINGTIVANQTIKSQNTFTVQLQLLEELHPGKHKIVVRADQWFIMDYYTSNRDYRPLAWKLLNVNIF